MPFYVTLILDIVKVFLPVPVDVCNLLNHVKSGFFFPIISSPGIIARKSTKTISPIGDVFSCWTHLMNSPI